MSNLKQVCISCGEGLRSGHNGMMVGDVTVSLGLRYCYNMIGECPRFGLYTAEWKLIDQAVEGER